LALRFPVKESDPPEGLVWLIVRVKIPDPLAPEPVKAVVKMPRLTPPFWGGTNIDWFEPVNFIAMLLPAPASKVAVETVAPLTADPPILRPLNVPVVVKVTVSAFVADAVNAMKPATSRAMNDILKRLLIVDSFVLPLNETSKDQKLECALNMPRERLTLADPGRARPGPAI
jgi:hypothetical protein